MASSLYPRLNLFSLICPVLSSLLSLLLLPVPPVLPAVLEDGGYILSLDLQQLDQPFYCPRLLDQIEVRQGDIKS